ncbi:MAG: hypothetical protein IJT00_04300, partial [Lachnospiraceae bacterium]|nr:hypothetical protein [Lachnospiraceae bacterium]
MIIRVFMVLVLLALFSVLGMGGFFYVTRERNAQEPDEKKEELRFGKGRDPVRAQYFFGEDGKNIRELLAPDGANTNPLPYMTINDGGQEVYIVALYADKINKETTIATTFTPLFNYKNAVSSVFVNPLGSDSVKRLNKRINMLDAARYAAAQEQNINRLRTITAKLQDAEAWAKKLDAGMNTLFEVSFLFVLRAESLINLQKHVADFQGIAKKSQIDLSACYAANPEGFLSGLPLNRIFAVDYTFGHGGFAGETPIKKHIFDIFSLATIYNHLDSEFYHDNGIFLGRNLYNGLPISFDPYDKSHFSFGIIIAGKTGYGKSATWKQMMTRLVDFGVHIVSIDFKPRGLRGEYAAAAEAVGGVSYSIEPKSKVKLNLFDLSEQTEFDENSGSEYRTLRLYDKIESTKCVLMTIATSGGTSMTATPYKAETIDRMETIVRTCIRRVYERIGLVDGDPDSLYETGGIRRGSFDAGRKKKLMPIMRDFYMELLEQHSMNEDRFKEDAYHLLIDAFEEYVGELYYCPLCLRTFTREEYESIPVRKDGRKWCTHKDGRTSEIRVIKGTKAYFDAQSDVDIDIDLPVTNFDISQIPESERPIMMLVCQSFVMEYFVKKNAINMKDARKLLVVIDEAHEAFWNPESRHFLALQYRTNRSRHVGNVLIMQSLADLSKYPDT